MTFRRRVDDLSVASRRRFGGDRWDTRQIKYQLATQVQE